MKDVLKYAFLGVGGFLLAKQFGLLPELTLPGSAGGGYTDGGSTNGESGSGSSGSGDGNRNIRTGAASSGRERHSSGAILAKVKSAARTDALNWDQWNWYYAQVTGKQGPAPEAVGITRTDPMPLISPEEWAAKITSGGLTL